MADDKVTPEGVDYRTHAGTVRAEIAPDPATAEHDVLAIVADLEGVAIDELPSLYSQVDHFVELLYETPPDEDAQMEIEFSYAGYRISLDQRGLVKLVAVKQTLDGA